MKRSLSLRELLVYGVPALGLMLAVLGYFLLVSPQKSRARDLESQVNGAQAALIAAHQKPVAPPTAHAVELFHLTTAMPDAADVPGLLLDLTRLAQASDISLTAVTPQAQITSGSYVLLPVTINVNGPFPNITKFLGLLRKQVSMRNQKVRATGRLIVANNVQLTSPDGRKVTATLALDSFLYNTAAPAATTPPATAPPATATTPAATS